LACRFNVRDVGFVDLETQPYGLFCYTNNSTEKDITDDFMALANAQLRETNIKAVAVNIDRTSDHPAVKYLKSDAKVFPLLILISPSEQAMPIDSIEKGQGFRDSLQKVIGKMVFSPMRQEIIENVINVFGVVLVVEGPNAEENKRAGSAAQAAIKKITSQMNLLPKAIAKPPVLLKMSRQQQEQEKILLWSMGIDADNITQPHAIILYGRGRRMGSVLSGKDITEEMLTKFLYVIGADCECGLDRSWMQGSMMPAKWDRNQLEKLSAQLGFDTEHPMIKMEMSQIIRKGKQSGNNTADLDVISGFGYREIEVKFDAPEPLSEPARQMNGEFGSNSQVSDVSLNNETPQSSPVERSEVEEDEFKLRNPLSVIGIAGILVLIIGVYFMISASGKKQ
jgi:hypothetical protein